MNKLLSLGSALAAGTLLSGCVFIFTPGKQKVRFTTATPDATIVYNQDSVGVGKATIPLAKKHVFQVVAAEKEGYKTGHYALQLTKLTPYYALSILDIGLYLGPLWEIHVNKVHRYDKKHVIPELIPMPPRQKGEKFMLVNNTSIDVKSKDVNVVRYRGIKNFMQKTTTPYVPPKRGKKEVREDMKVENAGFAEQLNSTLQSLSFTDTSRGVFPDVSNTLYLNAKIRTLTFHDVEYRNPKNYGNDDHLISIEMGIDWEVLNYYKVPVYTLRTNKKSDLFVFPRTGTPAQLQKEIGNAIDDAISDNLTYALIEMRNSLTEKKLLEVTDLKNRQPLYGELLLSKPADTKPRINDCLKAGVSIKVDEGHGSGVIVSADGYIVTNYHVVANTHKLEVIFNDGTTAEAEVIRKNPDADLALLKVNKTGLNALILSDVTQPEVGVDAWAIGTPKSLELGQSVSKGIVSGVRKTNGLTMLQIDANISPGNSGGALVNKDGVTIGIVSSKLIGYGTEGIGFAIMAADVLQNLNIKYK